jgi:hypothetical protein
VVAIVGKDLLLEVDEKVKIRRPIEGGRNIGHLGPELRTACTYKDNAAISFDLHASAKKPYPLMVGLIDWPAAT